MRARIRLLKTVLGAGPNDHGKDEAAFNINEEPTGYTLVRSPEGWKIVRASRRRVSLVETGTSLH